MLKPIDELVIKILKDYPETRSNDKLLVIKVWEYQGLKLNEQQVNFLLNVYTYNSESITRSRREIQSRGLYRSSPDVLKQRNLFEELKREEYRTVI